MGAVAGTPEHNFLVPLFMNRMLMRTTGLIGAPLYRKLYFMHSCNSSFPMSSKKPHGPSC